MSKKLNEDLMTPVFQGDDLSVNAALQSWTSLVQVFSSVDSSVQDNVNRLAILNALSNIISQKVHVLTQPAQASMAAATAGTVPSQDVNPSVMSPIVPTAPPVEKCEVEDEEEEKVIQSDEEGKEPVNPSTEADGPEVVELGDAEEKANDEADKDKKAVVDLTIEARLAKLESKPKEMSESTKRLLELAGLRVKL